VVLVGSLALRVLGVDPTTTPRLRVAATVFVAVCVQALPFLVLGVLLSGFLAAVVSPAMLRRVLPARPALAVPVATAAGIVLPAASVRPFPSPDASSARACPRGPPWRSCSPLPR